MKGMALYDRLKEKDAWDIYYCMKHFEGGVHAFAKEFIPVMENKLVAEGLMKIRKKFITIDSIGPASVAAFEEVAGSEERVMLQRDAFEQVNALLDILEVPRSKNIVKTFT